jgi:hypothetical protein
VEKLFSTAALSGSLFHKDDRYRLFANLVYPHLVKARAQLKGCYCADNGRVAVEPILLLGVSVLQYLDGLPGSCGGRNAALTVRAGIARRGAALERTGRQREANAWLKISREKRNISWTSATFLPNLQSNHESD